jgi:hypothetical protein
MRSIAMFIATTAMVLMTANSVRGNTNPGPLMLGGRAVVSEFSSLSAVAGDASSTQTLFPAVQNFTFGRLFVSPSPDDGNNGCRKGGHSLSFDGKPCPPPPPPPPPPRSKKCPCDSHGNPIDKDCGKGNDSSNP